MHYFPTKKRDHSPSISTQRPPLPSKEYVGENLPDKNTSLPSPLDIDAGKYAKELDHLVDKWIKYFSTTDKERFQRFLLRGEAYRPVVQAILEDNDIPREFYYLAMIESGYVTHAHSRARAMGVWQFIKGTGQKYHLEINHYVDERRDPIRATEAAAKYLRDLYRAFQSWELAMAAYNAGEYRILSTIMRGKTRNFWELSKKKLLPRETRNYVPKFLAAALIGADPEKYGLSLKGADAPYPDVTAIELPSPIRLKDLARITGIDTKELQRVNPHLIRGITPPHLDSYELWVPDNFKELISSNQAKISSIRMNKVNGRTYASAKDETKKYHRVTRGDSLWSISRNYKIPMNHLMRLNNLRSGKIYLGQKLRLSTQSYHRQVASHQNQTEYYRVKRGDSLYSIARRQKISIRYLKKINSLQSNRIYPGMTLRITRR